jgi:pilus assembly protein CpaC
MHRAAEWGFAGGCNGSQGGEADVKNDQHDAAVPRTRSMDRTTRARSRLAWRSTLVSIAMSLAVATTPCVPGFVGAAHAQRMIVVGAANRTASIVVAVGKSDDVRTDQPFVDIMVGNPDIADVNALTDHTLSILGKKIGTTRVTVYGQDKKLVGIFDIEVSYDVSRLGAEIARFTGGGIKVSSIDGRIMLSGTAPDAVTLDKAVTIAKQFAPDIIIPFR